MGISCATKLKVAFFQPGVHEDFGHVPVIEHRVRGEIFRHLAEACLHGRLASCAAHARFGIADDAGRLVDHLFVDERFDGEIGRRRIASGIGHEARATNPFAAELG